MADGGNALGSMQRLVEERTQQAATAQQALMHLQQDHTRLTANLCTAQQQAASRLVSLQNGLNPHVNSCLSPWHTDDPDLLAWDVFGSYSRHHKSYTPSPLSTEQC